MYGRVSESTQQLHKKLNAHNLIFNNDAFYIVHPRHSARWLIPSVINFNLDRTGTQILKDFKNNNPLSILTQVYLPMVGLNTDHLIIMVLRSAWVYRIGMISILILLIIDWLFHIVWLVVFILMLTHTDAISVTN